MDGDNRRSEAVGFLNHKMDREMDTIESGAAAGSDDEDVGQVPEGTEMHTVKQYKHQLWKKSSDTSKSKPERVEFVHHPMTDAVAAQDRRRRVIMITVGITLAIIVVAVAIAVGVIVSANNSKESDQSASPTEEPQPQPQPTTPNNLEPTPVSSSQPNYPQFGSVPQETNGNYVNYYVKNVIPRDPNGFTQGFVYYPLEYAFYMSNGLYGASNMQKVDSDTGEIIDSVPVPAKFFAEGCALRQDKLYQLTWQENSGIMYLRESLEPFAMWTYEGEGWGLTIKEDESVFYHSDGTSEIRILNASEPLLFEISRINVKYPQDNRAVINLNELEYIWGEIWANIWHSNEIVRIDPETGFVRSRLNLTDVVNSDREYRKSKGIQANSEAVLNGIAFDPITKRIWVTGKQWGRIYEIVPEK